MKKIVLTCVAILFCISVVNFFFFFIVFPKDIRELLVQYLASGYRSEDRYINFHDTVRVFVPRRSIYVKDEKDMTIFTGPPGSWLIRSISVEILDAFPGNKTIQNEGKEPINVNGVEGHLITRRIGKQDLTSLCIEVFIPSKNLRISFVSPFLRDYDSFLNWLKKIQWLEDDSFPIKSHNSETSS